MNAKRIFVSITILYSAIISHALVYNLAQRPRYVLPADDRPMQYWVIRRYDSLADRAPDYRMGSIGLEQKSRQEQGHYWRNVKGRLINIRRLQEDDLRSTTNDIAWIEEKLRVLGIQAGYVDQETWKVVGEDPEGKGLNSPAAKLKRHWLTLMFLDPGAAEEFNKSVQRHEN